MALRLGVPIYIDGICVSAQFGHAASDLSAHTSEMTTGNEDICPANRYVIDWAIGFGVPTVVQCAVRIEPRQKWPRQAPCKIKIPANDNLAIRLEVDRIDLAMLLHLDGEEVVPPSGRRVELGQARRD